VIGKSLIYGNEKDVINNNGKNVYLLMKRRWIVTN